MPSCILDLTYTRKIRPAVRIEKSCSTADGLSVFKSIGEINSILLNEVDSRAVFTRACRDIINKTNSQAIAKRVKTILRHGRDVGISVGHWRLVVWHISTLHNVVNLLLCLFKDGGVFCMLICIFLVCMKLSSRSYALIF